MQERHTETIGERLLRVRRERRLTQRDIATAGVTAQYISRVERGERTPSVKALRELAGSLGVTAHYLETGEDVPSVQLRALRIDDLELALRLGEPSDQLEGELRALLKEAVESGDRRTATRARLALGVIASHLGEHQKAIARLERAIEEPWVSPQTNPDAYITLGHSLAATGRQADAVTLFETCLDDLRGERPQPANAVTRFATFLSYALTEVGDLDGARVPSSSPSAASLYPMTRTSASGSTGRARASPPPPGTTSRRAAASTARSGS